MACSNYQIFAEDLNPAKMTDDSSEDKEEEEEDNWDGTLDETVIPSKTITERAMIASHNTGGVLVSWRWLSSESEDTSFDIYRDGIKLNQTPITNSSNYKDLTAQEGTTYNYEVKNAITNTSLCSYSFKPEKDKLQSPEFCSGRGRMKRSGLPTEAIFSIIGPPG